MKKKLFIFVSIFMLLVFGLIYKNYLNNKRYEIMKISLFFLNQTTWSVYCESSSYEIFFHRHKRVVLKLG